MKNYDRLEKACLIRFLCKHWWFSACIPNMMQSQSRMMNEHAWTCITHYDFCFFFHTWFVAVNKTFTTCAFFVLKNTLIQPQKSIIFEFLTLIAQLTVRPVVVFTIDIDHIPDSFLFTFHTFMFWIWRLRWHLHINPFFNKINDPTEHIRIYPKILGIYNSYCCGL
jgi:hypothetical protein